MIRGYRSRLLWLICLSILPFIVKTNAVLRTRVIILRGKIREILSQLKFMNNWCRVVYASWHSLKNPQWANGDSQTINSAHVAKFVNILSRMDETRFEKGSENYTYLKTGTRPWLRKKNGDFPKLKRSGCETKNCNPLSKIIRAVTGRGWLEYGGPSVQLPFHFSHLVTTSWPEQLIRGDEIKFKSSPELVLHLLCWPWM